MNEFFAQVDWAVIGIKLLSLTALLFFSKQTLKELLFDKPSADIREQVESSLFMLVAFTFVWHLLGSYISYSFSKSEMTYEQQVQVYYFFFSFYEVLGLSLLAMCHWLKKCSFSKVCRWVYYLSTGMVALHLVRYLDRVYFETDYLDSVYMPIKTGLNIATLVLVGAYPVMRLIKLKPFYRWE
ncbi:hypothetical protein [Pseudoalteromonas rubra]|uniref:Uncharacterized protein n=1 Tax=Pseudoalteromonas rubra TaxID=43658 RepID=A0A0F4Q4U3_9GAMM|nr:hypothetical protein [Pseudoalteromonas rubra]KJZ02349.1 hypothetical protein TW77_24055 [Pseudoalteromonas rubra]